jgi:trehalose 6-phosphate synthase/phosphatase
MGIDEKKYASLPLQDDVKHQVELIRNNFKDTKADISVDRLDYSKGILQRLEAFEFLLQLCPECIERIALYMIVVPSRDTVPQYAHLRDEIDKKVGNINSIYRTMDWSPDSLLLPFVPDRNTFGPVYHGRCMPDNPHARWHELGKQRVCSQPG